MRRNSLAWTWLSGLLTMAGYWAPWVSHKSPALVLIGFDLAEFVKFTPAYRTGTLPGLREALWVPPAAAALLLALAIVRGRAHPLWARAAASATGFLMAFTLLPPFPYRADVLFSAEFRGQTTLALVGMTACGVALLFSESRIAQGWYGWKWTAVPVAVLGIALPVWEFAQLKPLFDSLYGRPATLGVGIPLTAVGLALALWGVWNMGRREAVSVQGLPWKHLLQSLFCHESHEFSLIFLLFSYLLKESGRSRTFLEILRQFHLSF